MSKPSSGPPPPEAVLIRRAREAIGISPEVASERVRIKLSGRRWRQLEAGEETPGGTRAVMNDGQLAHMASVVGLRPDDLESIDKGEAGAILREIQRQGSGPRDRDADLERAERLLAEATEALRRARGETG